jgi:hypothetical protein
MARCDAVPGDTKFIPLPADASGRGLVSRCEPVRMGRGKRSCYASPKVYGAPRSRVPALRFCLRCHCWLRSILFELSEEISEVPDPAGRKWFAAV